ncbi:MAG: peptide chain release factor 2 [Oscillospiraceae bacterium]|jgi:peptide chain release factor 2|nr:peptide chain release factor 2 [Oscillospiraceae bacterium]
MIELEQALIGLDAIEKTIDDAGVALDIENLSREVLELEQDMQEPDFWSNLERSTRISRKAKHSKDKIEGFRKLKSRVADVRALIEMVNEEDDASGDSMAEEILREAASIKAEAEALKLETFLRGEFDANDAILALHAGAGGTEAQDWANMLFRMYLRYCERHGYNVKILDVLDGDEAGIKSATISIAGGNAYGFLRGEKGVHRLVRISPFDSNARRHTSFASLDVSPVIEESSFVLNMEEVRIDTFRASGAGGQHINKTDSAVRMTHIPTNIVVSCQNERSQVQNREVCLMMLRSRLLELREREREERMSDIKGEMKKIEWGSQIRSYVFHPYSMVKDHRTNYEVGNTDGVMDGDLDGFITAYLQMQ